MKYSCDMVKDLMPLCIDHEASESSKKAVLEHMAECQECLTEYQKLSKEIVTDEAEGDPQTQYVELAGRLRKQKRVRRGMLAVLIALFFGLCVNFAAGYRLTPRKAADLCGRLTKQSKVIGSYKWGRYMYYFYDSESCYDVVMSQRTWHGWKSSHSYLNWPKWYLDPATREGMEMAGAEYFVAHDHGIQVFPFISWDEKVKRVDATVFGITKSTEVETGEFTLLTFDDAEGNHQGNADTSAAAYDADGNVLYTMETERGYWMWKKVQ